MKFHKKSKLFINQELTIKDKIIIDRQFFNPTKNP